MSSTTICDDGVARRPALVVRRRVEGAHVERAHRAMLGELAVREGHRGELAGGPRQQVLGRDEAVVGEEERLELRGGVGAAGLGDRPLVCW